MTHKTFVSSTFEDLKDHRAYVIKALRKAGFFVDPMEDWTASTDEPKQFSADRVKGCDLCVLLVALRRGHVPEGEKLSITQLEYGAALKLAIDVLVFMLDEQAPWIRKFDELEKDPELQRWRNDLREQKGVGFFGLQPDSIEIASALTRWLEHKTDAIASKSKPDGQDSAANIKAIVAQLLPSDLQEKFEYSEGTALTRNDEAGLALIAELIDKKAEKTIRVIGRGPQLIDRKTSHYVECVARAILRGIEYKRILLLDPDLPQNGLLWLLVIERFLRSSKWRDSVHLYVKKTDLSNMAPQFQILDDKYLHEVFRSYSKGEAGASNKAYSQFRMAPHGEVSQHCEIYQNYLLQADNRYEHARVVDLLSNILHDLDSRQQNITYHGGLVLEVIDFLEHLNVQDLPPRGIKFVGSLMPFTFTYQAAERFTKRAGESDSTIGERLIVLPFGRLGDAIEKFNQGRLDYLCVPVANSHIDNLVPPTASESLLDSLEKDSHRIFEVDLPVKFVLSGIYQKSVKSRRLVAVEAAYLQIRERLPKNVLKLPRYEEEVESNYHAAWLAANDITLIAVTTFEAAKHFNLWTYKELLPRSERNETKFAIYSH